MNPNLSIVGPVPGTWKIVTIGELCDQTGGSVQTGPFGSQLHAEDYKPVGVPVVMPQNLGNNKIDTTDIARVDEADVKRLAQHRLKAGDIIFPPRGDISRYAYITEEYAGWLCGTGCLRIRLGNGEVDPKFLAYYLGHSAVQYWIVGNAVGTTMLNLNTSIFRSLPVALPPAYEQHTIAHILGTLDDKIELNRQMNATLEATMRAIFQSWFVDFDPVHAKARSEQLAGMDAETATLFPDAFEESELGPIPAGWDVLPLSKAIVVNPTRRLRQGEIAPYLPMPHVPTNTMRPEMWEYREVGSGARFMNGDVLLARITPSLENGKTAYIDFLEDGQVGWGSTEYIVLRSSEGFPPEYAYFIARDPNFRDYAITNMTGTSGRQRVPVDALDHYSVVMPPQSIAERFGSFIQPISQKMKLNTEQSHTLSEIRDALLPKLISGEIRVREVDSYLEDVS